MTPGATTCPQAIRTKNRRRTMKQTWQTVSWKNAVSAFIAGKSCEWCGSKEALLAHHPYQDTKDGVYPDLYLSGCVCVCNKCHFMYHRRHKKICEVCHVNYRHLDTEMCYPCWLKANPAIVAARKKSARELKAQRDAEREVRNAKTRAAKRRHPCKSRMISGRCQRSAIGSRCQYAPTKAEGKCMDFVRKKGMVSR